MILVPFSSCCSCSFRSKKGSNVLFPGALPLASAGVGGYIYIHPASILGNLPLLPLVGLDFDLLSGLCGFRHTPRHRVFPSCLTCLKQRRQCWFCPMFKWLDAYSYGHLPVISTYNPIYRMYNPIYNQL